MPLARYAGRSELQRAQQGAIYIDADLFRVFALFAQTMEDVKVKTGFGGIRTPQNFCQKRAVKLTSHI